IAEDIYANFTSAVKRISSDQAFIGRKLYPYCKDMFDASPSVEFLKAIIAGGSRWAEEKYLSEQSSEADAKAFFNFRLRQTMLRYQEAIPDCQGSMLMCFGYFSAPPETTDTNPGVDWKVHMDMEMNTLANSLPFSGLYGVMYYHSSYADEESQRWLAKLYRHYCIEGKTQMLSKDPYVLPHIQNPDFAAGESGWQLSPAETGSMSVKNVPGLSWLQGRYNLLDRWPEKFEMNNAICMRRSSKSPNKLSQRIMSLTPGRLYSLKMMTADHSAFEKGQDAKQEHQMSVVVKGVDVIPAKSFVEQYPSSKAGHVYGPFTRENNLWITFRRVVFRAKSKSADLTISDWAGDTDPGGPIGQELMHNFIQVQPYLGDGE
ncbi:MAG: hypothetical protein Q7T05_07005, partial [Dehalococcoidia bacterium]|nr:hypothetical protein [Dehalococcoidia bacterium]